MSDSIVKHYIFLRSDLPGYNCGMLAAQVAHVSFAILHNFYSHIDTQEYLSYNNSMHTVVFEIKEDQLSFLEEKFKEMKLEYSVWHETPSEWTCLCPRPLRLRDFPEFAKLKKNFKLFSCATKRN